MGDWLIEPMRNRICHEENEEGVQVEPKVMEVLLCLAERPGKTVTKEQFKEEVWTDTVVTDDVLSRCISELRKVFDDDSRDPSYIETIRKTGYRLIASVEIPEDSEESTPTSNVSAIQSEDALASPGLLDQISNNLRVSWSGARDRWVLVAGGIVERKWVMLLGGILGLLLIVSLFSWSGINFATSSPPPNAATPFTSFPGEEFDPVLSTNGQQLVFSWRNVDSLRQNIYLMQQGADRPLRLSADSSVDWSPTWSPDGRFVAYARDIHGEQQVHIVPSIGGRGRTVHRLHERSLQDVAWSPDTTQTTLAISAQQRPHQAYGLSVVYPDADSVLSLTTPPLWSLGDSTPVFSPDGSQIAFVRGLVQGVEDIFVMPASGGDPTRVTNDSTNIHGLTWTEDGTHLVYSARREGITGLWRVEADGDAPKLIRSANEGMLFSHPSVSSGRLAYTQRASQFDIWKLSRSTSGSSFQSEPVIASTQEDVNPSISPNGKQIAFVSERSGNYEVWVAQADGSNPSQLTSLNGPVIQSVSWSYDGSRLSFVARRQGQSDLYVVPAAGGPTSRLTDTPAEEHVPRWSRNNNWIYFSSNRSGTWEVWRTPVSTADSAQQVTSGGAVAAQESATAETLYLVRSDTTGIWSAPLDTSAFPLQFPDSQSVASTNRPLPSSGAPPSELRSQKTTDTQVQQLVGDVPPSNQSNWWVGEEGIYFTQRQRLNDALLMYVDIPSGQTQSLHTFRSWNREQTLAVSPGGNWFVFSHDVRQESDVMLVEKFQ